MCLSNLAFILLVINTSTGYISEDNSKANDIQRNYEFVNRKGWNARAPVASTALKTPVPYVVIHHSYIPSACHNSTGCCDAMRSMQDYHMDGRGWWDIGYNFAVGSDGVVYDGRGWSLLGAHSLRFNNVSLGICLIGDWNSTLPPENQLKAVRELIKDGVRSQHIRPDYHLIGHRQVRHTECPGEQLYDLIKTWGHYSPFPASASDVDTVMGLQSTLNNAPAHNITNLNIDWYNLTLV